MHHAEYPHNPHKSAQNVRTAECSPRVCEVSHRLCRLFVRSADTWAQKFLIYQIKTLHFSFIITFNCNYLHGVESNKDKVALRTARRDPRWSLIFSNTQIFQFRNINNSLVQVIFFFFLFQESCWRSKATAKLTAEKPRRVISVLCEEGSPRSAAHFFFFQFNT